MEDTVNLSITKYNVTKCYLFSSFNIMNIIHIIIFFIQYFSECTNLSDERGNLIITLFLKIHNLNIILKSDIIEYISMF